MTEVNKRTTPLGAIRKKCLWCCLDQPSEVRECRSERSCSLWAYRMGGMPKIPKPSPLKAVRARCLDCVEGASDVKDCGDTECALWPYRFGRNPAYSEASRKEARRRLETRRLSEKSLSERAIFKGSFGRQ